MYKDLEDLVKRSAKSREIKRGLAVQRDLAGQSRKLIAEVLGVCLSFVSKWRLIFDEYGVNGLISTHQGGASRAFLKTEQKEKVLAHIRSQEVFGPGELAQHLKSVYGISFQSPQSYYELLHEAGKTWHKSQKANPRRDEQEVQQRRHEIKKNSKKSENRLPNRKL